MNGTHTDSPRKTSRAETGEWRDRTSRQTRLGNHNKHGRPLWRNRMEAGTDGVTQYSPRRLSIHSKDTTGGYSF